MFVSAASVGLSEEQIQIQELATDFAQNEMAPKMLEWDEKVRDGLVTCPASRSNIDVLVIFEIVLQINRVIISINVIIFFTVNAIEKFHRNKK